MIMYLRLRRLARLIHGRFVPLASGVPLLARRSFSAAALAPAVGEFSVAVDQPQTSWNCTTSFVALQLHKLVLERQPASDSI